MRVNGIGRTNQIYIPNIYPTRANTKNVGMQKKTPSSNPTSSLENFVLGGGIIDGNGELIAKVPEIEEIYKLDTKKIYTDIDKTFGTLAYNLTKQKNYSDNDKDYDIYSEARGTSQKSKILSYSFVESLFPAVVNSMWENSGVSLIDNLFGNKNDSGLLDILNSINQINKNLVEFQGSLEYGQLSENDYSVYLEKNSTKLEELANDIVKNYDAVTQDEKAYAIMDWVQENLTYTSDIEHNGTSEKWSKPTETLRDLLADCEDGGFLESGLALHADIDPDRSRFIGGLVRAGTNAETGGHGYWIYKRENDDEWVPMDWCYLPNKKSVDERTPLKFDNNYISDWFVVMGNGLTIDTGAVNTVRNPEKLDRWDDYNVGNGNYSLGLGEFRTTGKELRATHNYLANKYLEQGLEIPGVLAEGSNLVFFLSELNKRLKEENIIELQK